MAVDVGGDVLDAVMPVERGLGFLVLTIDAHCADDAVPVGRAYRVDALM